MHKILVVDDFQPFGSLIQRLTTKRGHACLVTTKAREGLRLARAEKPDLVLLDLSLPELNGFELLKLLREDRHTRGISVLVTTGNVDENDLLQAASLGLKADDFIHKSLGNDAIVDRIEAVIAKRPARPTVLAPFLECGSLKLDVARREAWRDGHKIPLKGPVQFDLLHALAAKPRGLSVADLLQRVWQGQASPKTVAKTVQRLRTALRETGDDLVYSIPGGYRLVG